MNGNTTTCSSQSGRHARKGRLLAHLAIAAVAGIAALVALAGPAAAQIDSGSHDVYQWREGSRVLVGQIFVGDKADRDNYVEHWVTFPGYTYPSAANGVAIEVVPSRAQVRTDREFFAQSFPPGSRYIQVIAHESDTVPTQAPPTSECTGSLARASVLPVAVLGGDWGWVASGAAVAFSALRYRRRGR